MNNRDDLFSDEHMNCNREYDNSIELDERELEDAKFVKRELYIKLPSHGKIKGERYLNFEDIHQKDESLLEEMSESDKWIVFEYRLKKIGKVKIISQLRVEKKFEKLKEFRRKGYDSIIDYIPREDREEILRNRAAA